MPKIKTFNFVGHRRKASYVSIALVTVSLICLLTKGLNFGLDFTGGTLVELSFSKPAEPTLVRDQLKEAGFKDPVVQKFGSDTSILIRVQPEADKKASTIGDKIFKELGTKHTNLELRRVEFVGPKVGEELSEQGGLATIVALMGILIYVMFRFEYRFALGSVIALMHDVIITLGLFSLAGIEFDLTVLAALLAVIGYSLNDTIVVYDRIRENFRKLRKMNSEDIVNNSLNQTLSRTLVTSLTTLLVLISLYYFGGELIHAFSIALIVGVIIGTYSSIYVASSVILALGISRSDLVNEVKKDEETDETVYSL